MTRAAAPRRRGTVGPTTPTEVELARRWIWEPVNFAEVALGMALDPWQCDFLDAYVNPENERLAIRAAHSCGKTCVLATANIHFLTTRPECRCPSTAPTYAKQVRDILWAEIAHWWMRLETRAPWLYHQFELQTTALRHRQSPDWYAVGIASKEAVNMEGYHAAHVLVTFDEAKGIKPKPFESVHGMLTTQETKFLVASTPGGATGEFHRVFTKLRATWKHFSIHPTQIRSDLEGRLDFALAKGNDPATGLEVEGRYADGGAYFSDRPKPGWAAMLAEEWGTSNPAYIARVEGLFPSLVGDELYPYPWLTRAESFEEGVGGPVWVACDVARFGRDRTIMIVMRGGTALWADTIGRTEAETTARVARKTGVGSDPRHPLYRETTVTADSLVDLRLRFNAEGIAVDEGTFGAGIVDDLKRRGEHVRGINFGAQPTDTPRTDAQRASRRREGRVESRYVNLKAEMADHLRRQLEVDHIALGHLEQPFVRTLIAQMGKVKGDFDSVGRLKVVDPDEDEDAMGLPDEEGKRSPDHFHALMIGVWVACERAAAKYAAGAALPPGIARVGVPTTGATAAMAGQIKHAAAGRVGGQGAYIGRLYNH